MTQQPSFVSTLN